MIQLLKLATEKDEEERAFRRDIEIKRIEMQGLEIKLRDLESNLFAMELSKENLVDLSGVNQRMRRKLERNKRHNAVQFSRKMDENRKEIEEQRLQRRKEAEEIFEQEKQAILQKKAETNTKSKRDVQKYFAEVRKKNEDKIKAAIKRAEEDAKKLNKDNHIPQESSRTESIEKYEPPIRYVFGHKNKSYQEIYSEFYQQRILEIRDRYKRIDFDEMKEHEDRINKVIRERKTSKEQM